MKILLDVPAYAIDEPALATLERREGLEFERMDAPNAGQAGRVLDPSRIGYAEVLVGQHPPTNLADMRALRWIQITSAGYDQMIALGLAERGIRVTNSRGCFDVQIAEWNLCMMVNLVRDMRRLMSNQDAAVWDRAAAPQGEIRGRTVGFWGYGGFARETARLARSFGMRVHAFTRNGARPRDETYIIPGTGDPAGVLPHRMFSSGEEAAFLGGLDFLVVAMPLTRATEGLIGERELRMLPRTAYLLNPARGRILQEAALLRALQEGWIAGAALDTHFRSPLPAEHPLWRLRNVILTPHLAGPGNTPFFASRFWDLFAQNIERYSKGAVLLNELTPAELAGK